jgi:hypothetical protein
MKNKFTQVSLQDGVYRGKCREWGGGEASKKSDNNTDKFKVPTQVLVFF